MSLNQPFRPVIPVANNDTSTYYVSMQPVISGKSTTKFVSPKLTFKSSTNEFLLNNNTIGAKNTASGTKPTNPNVGDIWYDTSTDIQFQYIYDGLNFFWVDVSSLSIDSGFSNFAVVASTGPVGPTAITINYLIVAGGGSGAWSGSVGGGGGGAGGLLTGSLALVNGNTYSIVVGTGGYIAAGSGVVCAVKGNNSTAFGFTACGGGVGGRGCSFSAGTGGSGGGGGSYCGGKPGALATGSPALGVAGTQGYPGATGTNAPGLPAPPSARGGGGGGAGGAGTTTSGGAGYTWPYTANTYAGGGGGAVGGGGGSPGGSGGGGPGCSGANSAGLTFTGSGGGGNSIGSPRNISGAPGIVIFTIPDASYPQITIPGPQLAAGNVSVTTPCAAPGNRVITFRYPGSFSVANPAAPTAAYTANYLIVGGGGAGGTGLYGLSGGGGAGGLLQGCVTLTSSSTYAITIGCGGTAIAKSATIGTANGTNSTITSSAPGFSTITAFGGGGGGFYINPSSPTGCTLYRARGGGSGGGTGAVCNPLIGAIPGGFAIGSPGQNIAGTQGYPGGNQPLGYPYDGAGGGGAGGAGGAGANGPATPPAPGATRGGAGGAGYTWPFTGLTYASGGAGGSYSFAGNFTPATPGGGGAGGSASPSPGIGGNGTPGTGGGGGGAGGSSQPTTFGGNGGPGVVILAIPTPNYPGGYGPIASNPPSAPGKTVLTFTTPGSYIA